MGLFDDLAGEAKAALVNAAEGSVHGVLQNAISDTTDGGMSGLLDKLKTAGLGDQVSSWLSSGENLPVSASQVQAALGNEHVQQIAQSLGFPVDKAAELLAEHLPSLASTAS